MVTRAETFYRSKVKSYSLLVKKSIWLSQTISRIRLLTFIFTAALLIWFAQTGNYSGICISLLTGIIVFLILIRYHSKVLNEKKYREAVLRINSDELKVLDGNFSSFDGGNEFIDPDHPFSYDLDVFGDGSLFQYLNRTVTNHGREALADKLLNPLLQTDKIIGYQQAIAELSDKTEWRQDFQATGMIYNDNKYDKDRIIEWLNLPPLFCNSLYGAILILVPTLTAVMILLSAMCYISGLFFMLYMMLPIGIVGIYSGRINRRHQHVSKTSQMLLKYSLLIRKAESLEVSSSSLIALKKKLLHQHDSASQQLRLLSKILAAIDTRLNPLAGILLNVLMLWDIFQMRRLEKWQQVNKLSLPGWFDAFAEFDWLISFAGYYYNNPDFCFPDINDKANRIEAEQMGHPLIHSSIRVTNPVLIRKGQFIILTGANMAGKSTYLRTIGANMILAMCGAPVCAKSFRFQPVNVFTSIHTSDSLAKNESYFYSELKRLKRIIDELQKGSELFIFLDEILKGTNSRDKHAGSEALLKQMIGLKASGIIATHDVSLASLQNAFPHHIITRCFEGGIDGDQLRFSYKLGDGISKNMNATLLMREMGITV